MRFISYAQNLEDVMLNRVFQDQNFGFYIDVGAQHPVKDSVTHAFYKRGWMGINIEPTDTYSRKLRAARRRDHNIQALAGNTQKDQVLFEIPNSGLSTTNRVYAERGVKVDRNFTIHERTVPTRTLDEICEAHYVGEVDFLKIDVEGSEESVLRGFSFTKIRPKVLVIKATEPLSSIPSHASWEPYLLSHGYKRVYFDGLNNFYLANECSDLERHFQSSPNADDNYKVAIRFDDEARALVGVIGRKAKRLFNLKPKTPAHPRP